jgi:transposase
LARPGFFKPVHVKSLSAHALRSLIIARKKLVRQRMTWENQIRRPRGRVRDPAAPFKPKFSYLLITNDEWPTQASVALS